MDGSIRRTMRRRPSLPALLGLVITVGVVGACSSGGDDGDDGAGDVVDSAFEELDELSGETVEDTDITYENGSDSLRIGGVELVLPDLAEYVATESDFPIPSTWPTLARMTLVHDPDGLETVEYGLAVLGQTTVATEDDRRQAVIDQVWGANQIDDLPTTHESVVTGDDRTCWIEVRSDPDVDDSYQRTMSLVIAAGPGIASFGVAVHNANPSIDAPGIAGDVVEQICGSRPQGL